MEGEVTRDLKKRFYFINCNANVKIHPRSKFLKLNEHFSLNVFMFVFSGSQNRGTFGEIRFLSVLDAVSYFFPFDKLQKSKICLSSLLAKYFTKHWVGFNKILTKYSLDVTYVYNALTYGVDQISDGRHS